MKSILDLIYGRECFSDWIKKVVITIIAAVGIGFSVSFIVVANIGSNPTTLLGMGIGNLFGTTVGMGMTISNSLVLLFLVIFGKQYIYAATWFIIAFMGISVDLSEPLIRALKPDESFLWGLIFCLVGLALLGFFIGFYISLNFGGGAFDGLGHYLSVKINKPFSIAQLIFYIFCFIAGILLGAKVGVGTILGLFVTSLTVGPTIKFLNSRWSNILKLKEAVASMR